MNEVSGGGAAVEALRKRITERDDDALALILTGARSFSNWTDEPVTDEELRRLFDILKTGPTSGNSLPARFVFVRSAEAKARLIPALVRGNVAKVEAAPVTVIVGYEQEFWRDLPRLFPFKSMAQYYENDPAFAEITAFRNGTLEGAWLIVAARAMGLDTGAMSGFDNAKVDAEFFAGTTVKSNFLCCLGHGDPSTLPPPYPKYDFDEVCQII